MNSVPPENLQPFVRQVWNVLGEKQRLELDDESCSLGKLVIAKDYRTVLLNLLWNDEDPVPVPLSCILETARVKELSLPANARFCSTYRGHDLPISADRQAQPCTGWGPCPW